jgi:tetratricopeptide (TPR) repeat protein
VFFKFRDSVLNQVPSCGQKLRNDLLRGVPRVWENYYMLDTDKDIAFEIGRFYYGIRDYANALKFYVESSKTVGEHHVTYHNQGLCYYSQGKLEIALELFVKSLAMNGEYEKARNWVDKVKRELAEKRIDSSIPSLVTSASNITILPTNDSNVILDTASAVINDVVNVVSANSISITSTEPNTTTSVQND